MNYDVSMKKSYRPETIGLLPIDGPSSLRFCAYNKRATESDLGYQICIRENSKQATVVYVGGLLGPQLL